MTRRLLCASAPLLALLLCALPGCGGPPRQIELESPTPPPPPKTAWRFYSDAERIVDIAPTDDAVWAISQNGVLRWTRPGGQVNFAVGAQAPRDDATAIAVATDGTVYVGLKDAIAWRRRAPTAQWERLSADPLPAGVTALAPRRAGGVWVGMQRGLGWMHNGRLRLHSKLHSVRAMAVDAGGRLWAATARKGLVTLEGDRLVEHTTVNGLCGNDVRAVAVGGNQVVVVCNTPTPTLAIRVRNSWYPFSLARGGAAILDVQWQTGNWVIRSTGGWWRVVEQPPGTAASPGGPPAALEPIEPGRLPAPPALAQHARFSKVAAAGETADASASASAGASAKAGAPAGEDAPAAGSAAAADAQAAPTPAGPVVPPAPTAVEEILLECTRSEERIGTADGAPLLRLLVERPQLPDDGEVTVWRVGDDGFAWYGLAWRGLLAQKGQSTQRFTSQTLVPRHPVTRIAVDTQGRVMIPSLGPYIDRWTGKGWERRPVAPPTSAAQALAVAADPQGGAWLLIGYPPPEAALAPPTSAAPAEVDPVDAIAGAAPPDAAPLAPSPEVAVVRIEGARIERKGRLPILGLDRPVRVGAFDVSPLGEVHFALFFESERGTLRGAGLGRVPVSHDVLVRWLARRAFGEESVDGAPLLPDGWVSAITRPATQSGASPVILGTNAGLVRVAGGEMRVFDENDFIESEVITALATDARGRVWAGTLEGLGRLEGDTWTNVAAKGLNGRITRLVFDADGRLWAGTDRGLFHNPTPDDPDGWRAEPVRPGETARDVRDVVFGPGGGAWVLTGEGIYWRKP